MPKVYFIGIGGIGVSALARYYLSRDWEVFGNDLIDSEITRELSALGAYILTGDRIDIPNENFNLAIYSPAVPENNAQLSKFKSAGVKILSYPEALGELTKQYFTIAISGAHGKSTTTAMIGLILQKAGLNPTVIVGTKVKEFADSNFLAGNSKYLVIEACEYMRSFVSYWPKIAIVTNIEEDHLECYENRDNLISAFAEFVSHLDNHGILIANCGDKNTAELLKKFVDHKFEVKKFSLKQKDSENLRGLLKIPGDHNVANALAALETARILGISDKIAMESLASYSGSWRRFSQRVASIGGRDVIIVDDYGHHPTQIRLTLEGARAKWPDKRIVCFFQPHQALRTYLLFDDFVKVMQNVSINAIFITDIYQVAGREKPEISAKISSQKLVTAVNMPFVTYVERGRVLQMINDISVNADIIIMMGAGDIYNISKEIGIK